MVVTLAYTIPVNRLSAAQNVAQLAAFNLLEGTEHVIGLQTTPPPVETVTIEAACGGYTRTLVFQTLPEWLVRHPTPTAKTRSVTNLYAKHIARELSTRVVSAPPVIV